MTKTPRPFSFSDRHRMRCATAAKRWSEAFTSDPFAYANMYNDLFNRIYTHGDIEEVMSKANALIKAREDAKTMEM